MASLSEADLPEIESMIVAAQTFEVRVLVIPKMAPRVWGGETGQGLPASARGGKTSLYRKDTLLVSPEIRMFHIDAKSHEQALERGKKYGRPISARKFHREVVAGNIEHMKLDQNPYGADSPFVNAVAMDEMIWMKKQPVSKTITVGMEASLVASAKNKRAERIEENKKDRQSIDNARH